MNNAFLLEELGGLEDKPQSSEVEIAKLTKLLEAIDGVLKTEHWQTFVEMHFSKEEERIERLLLSEAKKTEVDNKEIYRLQGEMKWARRYADLRKWAEFIKRQLTQLNGN